MTSLLPVLAPEAWLPLAASLTVKATLVLAAAAGIAALLRRAPAAERHLAWTLALAALLVLPLLALALPVWRLPLLPAGAAPAWSGTPAPPADVLVAPPASAGTPVPTPMPAPALAPADVAGHPAPEAGVALTPPPAQPLPTVWPAAAETPAPARAASPLAGWLMAAWAAGVLLVLGRLAGGVATLRLLAARARPVADEEWCFLYDELAYETGLRRRVALVESDDATMPMTWGTFRPTILLPAAAREWDDERRRVVLLHEMAHVQRLDCLTQTLAQVCCALYWFHPGAWWAAERMRAERERACDERVLRAGARASAYAGHLIEVARRFRPTPLAGAAAVAMARPTQLEGRVLAVLDERRPRRVLTAKVGVLAAAAALVAAAPLAALHPVARAARDAWTAGGALAGLDRERATLAASLDEMRAGEGGAADTVRRDPRVTDGLVGALADPDAQVRRAAVDALAGQQDRRAVSALIGVLRDPDAEVRASAVHALGRLGDRAAVEPLVARLRDDNAEVRAAAADALGEMEDARAAGGLGAALSDESEEVRQNAASALSRMKDPAAVPALTAALADRSPEVRQTAAHALGELDQRSAVPALARLVRDPSAEVRKSAVGALAEIGDPSSADEIAAALADPEAEVRATAAWALAEIGVETAPPALLEMAARERNPQVRAKALWALGEIGDRRALAVARASARDPNAEVVKSALWVLSQLEDRESVDLYLELLRHPDAEVRSAAAEALAEAQ